MAHRVLAALLLLTALMGCVQSPGSGNIIPGTEIGGPAPDLDPGFAPLADLPAAPLPEGVECGSHVRMPVDFGPVGYSAPPAFFDITENDFVVGCRDGNVKEPAVNCEACGWTCAIESPYFYRFSPYYDEAGAAILTVHIWDLQCGDIGLEYRLPGQGVKEGQQVTAVYEPIVDLPPPQDVS